MRRPPQYPIRKTILVATLLAVCALPGLRAEEQLPLPGQRNLTDIKKQLPAASPILRPARYPWYSADCSRVWQALDRPMPKLDFDGLGFEDALKVIRDAAGVSMVVNWTAMEAAAIERDKEVNLRLAGVSIASALRALLNEVGGGETELTYQIESGFVSISTKEDLSRWTFVVVYDYRDMIALADAAIRGSPNTASALDHLIQTIQDTVEPESWRSAGGNVGAVNTFGDLIIITQSVTAYEAIYDLLETMRDTYRRLP